MDKEFFTASVQQWEEKILSGQAVFTLDYAARATMETEAYMKLHPEDTAFKFEPAMPLVSDYCQKPTLNIAEQTGIWSSLAVSADSPYIERILEMVDWMYSDEGAALAQWGREGEQYTIEDNKKKFVPEIKASYNPDGTIESMLDLGLNTLFGRIVRDDAYEPYIEGYSDTIDRYKNETEIFVNNYGINLTFTDEEAEESGYIATNIQTYVGEEALKFITGEKDMSEYDSFITYLKKNGAQRLEEIYAAAYSRYQEQINSID